MFFYLLLLLLLLWCGGHCRIDAVVVAADRTYILAPIYTLVMFSTLLLHMQRLFCCLQFSCPFLSRISSVISLHLSNPFLATFNIDDDDDDENTQPKLKTQQQIFSFLLNTNAKPCSSVCVSNKGTQRDTHDAHTHICSLRRTTHEIFAKKNCIDSSSVRAN